MYMLFHHRSRTITVNNKDSQAPHAVTTMLANIKIPPRSSGSMVRPQVGIQRLDEGMPLCKEGYCYETNVSP